MFVCFSTAKVDQVLRSGCAAGVPLLQGNTFAAGDHFFLFAYCANLPGQQGDRKCLAQTAMHRNLGGEINK